jgi:YesN/AraC family two-component response regulator
VLTSHDSPELVRQASRSGVGAYLLKPPGRNEMERAIAISMARFEDLMELRRLNEELQNALTQIRTLRELLPICSACKKIRDDSGYWEELESYMMRYSGTQFSHGICPDCMERLYPDLENEDEDEDEDGGGMVMPDPA